MNYYCNFVCVLLRELLVQCTITPWLMKCTTIVAIHTAEYEHVHLQRTVHHCTSVITSKLGLLYLRTFSVQFDTSIIKLQFIHSLASCLYANECQYKNVEHTL